MTIPTPVGDRDVTLANICALLRGAYGSAMQDYARAAVGGAWTQVRRNSELDPGMIMQRILRDAIHDTRPLDIGAAER